MDWNVTAVRSWPVVRCCLRATVLFGLLSLLGCTSGPFITGMIYDTPNAYVRLEVDRTLTSGVGHDHPAELSPEQVAAALRGIVIQHPLTRLPLYDDLSTPRRHPAFSEDTIAFWAPLLSRALGQATPEEVITFYQSRTLSPIKREVTSGGLFMEGEDLHIQLSNYRSETHYAADIGVADTMDDRLTPLRSLAPQKGTLHFEPAEFQRSAGPQGIDRLFHWERRELIIHVQHLPVRPLALGASGVR